MGRSCHESQMIDRLLNFLIGTEAPTAAPGPDELQLAVAALLIEAARMDDNFDATERATIERLLAERFALAPEAVQPLVKLAEQRTRKSAQYFPFTREITRRMSTEQRVKIIEMLWEVAYADGALDPHEDALLRQIAGLIHVPDRERGLARKRALEKAAAAPPDKG
jgi:uncharacterized tellurite resistance protein B-like protein